MLMRRGDTIVELVIAFAIFSLAAVASIAILNSGVATTQRNLEITLVRQQVDAHQDDGRRRRTDVGRDAARRRGREFRGAVRRARPRHPQLQEGHPQRRRRQGREEVLIPGRRPAARASTR